MSGSIALFDDPVYTFEDPRIDFDGHTVYTEVADTSTTWSELGHPTTAWTETTDPSTTYMEKI